MRTEYRKKKTILYTFIAKFLSKKLYQRKCNKIQGKTAYYF